MQPIHRTLFCSRSFVLVVVTCLTPLLLLSACGDSDTPQQRIERMIDAGESAVESRSLSATGKLISPVFQDHEGRGRKEMMQILAGLFWRHKHIHLLVQTDRIEMLDEQRARVLVYVAMAGHAITGVDDLASLRAHLYRFDLEVREEEGEWWVTSGSWRPADRSDFLG